jgi:hypothetical protein
MFIRTETELGKLKSKYANMMIFREKIMQECLNYDDPRPCNDIYEIVDQQCKNISKLIQEKEGINH